MTNRRPRGRRGDCLLFGLSLLLTSCASAPPARPREAGPSPDELTRRRAAEQFSAGREAALSGDFACAHELFEQSIATLQPPSATAPQSAETRAFGLEIYEGILRYEALAMPPEETAAGEGTIAPELQPIESPSASAAEISTAREAVASDTAGITYDIPIVVNDAVLKVLATFQGQLHDIIARGLARSGRYVPMIHRVFREEGIPTDLAQVALIESSFLPRARSPRAAHGIWQFMPRTGRQYGLTSNGVVDERSDPEKATRAAAKHLAYLHELFHDWFLALAAYNAGEGKILRAQERTGLNDFWQLAASGLLRAQTQNYVPAVIAATLISKNPEHYGFTVEYEAPLDYETIELNRPVRLADLAQSPSLDLESLQALNPELKTGVTPRQPEGYTLKIPSGQVEAARLAFAAAPTAKLPGPRRHTVKKGESLASIAHRYGVSTARLAESNGLPATAKVSRGEVLVVPSREPVQTASRRTKPAPAKTAAAAVPATVTRSYRVKGGDTLFGIARRTGTTVDSLLAANDLDSPEKIKPGDRLKIPPATRR
ncbi:MAG TPA: LysM peptidoglycan-binding domain-containing protein [Thermoanaerobaculia bacterium]|nr:LysM peptidoglycan-binding domain-containing protein [Thermoanaerobaculia bacterium]